MSGRAARDEWEIERDAAIARAVAAGWLPIAEQIAALRSDHGGDLNTLIESLRLRQSPPPIMRRRLRVLALPPTVTP